MRPWAKVALVWGGLALLFTVFNVLYWPVYRMEALTHPEAFIARADQACSAGEAGPVLQEGIDRFNPPCAAPYRRLAELEKEAGNEDTARFLEGRAQFYQMLHQEPASEKALAALTEAVPINGGFVASATVEDSLSRAAASFAAAFNMDDVFSGWTPESQVRLFMLGGSVFSFNGEIGETGTRAPVPLLVYSGGGMDERRGAHILVNGIDRAARQRGMHIVLLTPDSGTVIRADLFDLWDSRFEEERMSQFLNNAPDGCIGLFAVCDDGSAFMKSATEERLMDFGIGRRTFLGREPGIVGLRFSFAAIGVKGAPPDSAMQAWSPDWFQGRRGHPVVCAVFGGGEAL